MTYRIRPARPLDYEAICDLLIVGGLSTDRSKITVTFENCSYWLAVTDTPSNIGCIGLEHDAHASLLRSAVVHPDFQNMRLGAQLTEIALDACRARGDREVFLFTYDSGPYWERFGFARSSAAAVQAALPNAPQVKSGIERAWIEDIETWRLPLA